MGLIQFRIVKEYVTRSGASPYRLWLNSLKDVKTKARVQSRVLRLASGNFGDCRSVGQIDGDALILLLLGGDKSSQKRDIQKSKIFWRIYLED